MVTYGGGVATVGADGAKRYKVSPQVGGIVILAFASLFCRSMTPELEIVPLYHLRHLFAFIFDIDSIEEFKWDHIMKLEG